MEFEQVGYRDGAVELTGLHARPAGKARAAVAIYPTFMNSTAVVEAKAAELEADRTKDRKARKLSTKGQDRRAQTKVADLSRRSQSSRPMHPALKLKSLASNRPKPQGSRPRLQS